MVSLTVFLFVLLLMAFLGGAVLIDDPKRRSNILFFSWILFAASWMLANFLENVPSFPLPVREWLLRVDFSIAILAVAGVLVLFVVEFAGYRPNRRRDALILALPCVLAVLSFTPALVTSVFTNARGEIEYTDGWAYGPYGLVLIGYFVGSLAILLFRRRRTVPPFRNQISAVAVGLAMTLAVTIPINLFLQNDVSVSVQRFGLYSFLFFVIATSAAIVRHQFLRVHFFLAEMLFLGVLAVEMSRVVLSGSLGGLFVNIVIFIAILVFGFIFLQSVLKEIRQKEQLDTLSQKLASINRHLQLANKKLKELDALKTEFLSIASHQLRTPLAVAKGYLSMLAAGMVGRISKKQEETIMRLESNNEGLIALVNQLLDLSRIESNRLKINLSRVDLGKVASESLMFFAPRAKEKGLALRLEPPKASIFVTADPEKFREILTNLLDNAIKYTQTGGITVRLASDGRKAVIEVPDTGYGLTKSDKEHLFEKFASGSASKNASVTSGFGLFVVKKLAQAMNGSVSAESAGTGRGSTFRVLLPIAKSPR